MKIELIRSSHSVGESNLHLQFTPAYRRAVFREELIRILMRDYMLAQAKKWGFEITAVGFGNDHIHLFLHNWKNFSVAQLAKLLKGFTAFMMRKHHWNLIKDKLWGKKFWSAGYFYRTVGAVNAETVKRYVAESQDYKVDVEARQNTLLQFSVN